MHDAGRALLICQANLIRNNLLTWETLRLKPGDQQSLITTTGVLDTPPSII
jgi:hypothetical protein